MLQDSALLTPALARILESSYIGIWENCLIEHLVRLGEIRIAKASGGTEEETRIRKLHTDTFHFVLLPILEKKIEAYENDRAKYPDFKSFLPEILKTMHALKPADIDRLLK